MLITKLKIRIDGDPCLRKVSESIKEVTAGERFLLESMLVTMYAHDGLGLAAPQVGINRRMLVVDIGEGPLMMINPQVKSSSGSCELEEGCLSVPETTIKIARPQKILVRYLDTDGEWHERVFENLMARVLMHEIDHLDGKLIVDYL